MVFGVAVGVTKCALSGTPMCLILVSREVVGIYLRWLMCGLREPYSSVAFGEAAGITKGALSGTSHVLDINIKG